MRLLSRKSFKSLPLWALWLLLSALYLLALLAVLRPERAEGVMAALGAPLLPTPASSPPLAAEEAAERGPAQSPPTPHPPAAEEEASRYFLLRPIPPGYNHTISRFYPYGSTAGGRYQTHHGVEFENPLGTPVVAAGPGRVAFAGSDDRHALGPLTRFYGLVVVVEHPQPFLGQRVYSLYGHLESVAVEEGQEVAAGELLGRVGMTGIALGPHLHFEIRLGQNSYLSTRNPELWLQPFRGQGIVAARVQGSGEEPPRELWVGLYPQGESRPFRVGYTYARGEVNPDDLLGENLVLGDVPAGGYELRAQLAGRTVAAPLEVHPGRIVLVELSP